MVIKAKRIREQLVDGAPARLAARSARFPGPRRLAVRRSVYLVLALAWLGGAYAASAQVPAARAVRPAASDRAQLGTARYAARSGQSLSDLAGEIGQTHDRAARERIARALFAANPHAFIAHNPDRLRRDAVLSAPPGLLSEALGPAPPSAEAGALAASSVSAARLAADTRTSTGTSTGAGASASAGPPGGASMALTPAQLAPADEGLAAGGATSAATTPAAAPSKAVTRPGLVGAASGASGEPAALAALAGAAWAHWLAHPFTSAPLLALAVIVLGWLIWIVRRTRENRRRGSLAGAQASAGSAAARFATTPVSDEPLRAPMAHPVEVSRVIEDERCAEAEPATGMAPARARDPLSRAPDGALVHEKQQEPHGKRRSVPSEAELSLTLPDPLSLADTGYLGDAAIAPEPPIAGSVPGGMMPVGGLPYDGERALHTASTAAPYDMSQLIDLAELHAQRGDARRFSEVAHDVWYLTDGAGPDWRRVAALGARLEPDNPMYRDQLAAPPRSGPNAPGAASGVPVGSQAKRDGEGAPSRRAESDSGCARRIEDYDDQSMRGTGKPSEMPPSAVRIFASLDLSLPASLPVSLPSLPDSPAALEPGAVPPRAPKRAPPDHAESSTAKSPAAESAAAAPAFCKPARTQAQRGEAQHAQADASPARGSELASHPADVDALTFVPNLAVPGALPASQAVEEAARVARAPGSCTRIRSARRGGERVLTIARGHRRRRPGHA